MMEGNNHINYSVADIEKYWKGQLVKEDMHAMEQAALEDPFLADAMEGIRLQYGQRSLQTDVAELKERLRQRTTEKKAVPIGSVWWEIAAAVAVIAGGTWILTHYNGHKESLPGLSKIIKNEAASSPAKMDTVRLVPVPVNNDSSAVVAMVDKKLRVTAKSVTLRRKVKNQPFTISSTPAATASSKKKAEDNISGKELEKADGMVKVSEPKPTVATPSKADVDVRLQGKVAGMQANNASRANQNTANSFRGLVMDPSHQPVQGATVKIAGVANATTTDKEGNFTFENSDTVVRVSVQSLGYETQNLTLNNNDLQRPIILQPATQYLQEVTVEDDNELVLRKNNRALKRNMVPEPSIGSKKYQQYLEKNKKVPDDLKNTHGDVVVSFAVDKKGQPNNFIIKKSLNEQLDKEAIRLIRAGPSWHPHKRRIARVSVIVTF